MMKKKISQSSKLRCVFCQGEGVQPGTERLSCIVCKGNGRVTVNQPYNICKECGGRGKKAGANLYCLLCQGKGFVEESRQPNPPWADRAERIIKAKVGVKKGIKPFFKELLRTFKIL